MRKRTLIPLLIAVVLLSALGVMLYLRAKAPPEAARLLPESDAIVYVNLKAIRSVTHFDQTPIQRSPDFQHFIDATGIVPERDLDSVALALHRMPDPTGPNGPVAYSEVFIGRFDGVRLAHYLASIASSTETYAGRTIYTIPVGEPVPRQLRIAQAGYDVIAASNMPTPEQIHSMLDRFRTGALSTPGSSLLAARYHQVPLLSEAWGIGHIGLPFTDTNPTQPNGQPNTEPNSEPGFISILGLQLPLRTDTDFVASLGYTPAARVLSGGAVHLRIEEFAPDPTAASSTVDALTTLLAVLRGISSEQAANQQADPSTKATNAILNSITLTHHDSTAILNATASLDQLKSLTTANNPASSPLEPASPPASDPAATPPPK
ncbi:MAG: hypothetical protein WB439_06985 [Acidobacteriaceae bacterium]